MRSLLTVFLFAATVPAQPWLYPGPVEPRPWPGALSSGKSTGSTAGQFLGGGYPDVVIVRDGVPHLYASPGALNCLESAAIAGAPSWCSAIATIVKDRAPSGRRRDQLLVSHSGGLSAWGPTGNGDMAWTLVDADPLWRSLDKLVVADVNADGLEDIVALSVTNGFVMVRLGTSGGLGSGPSFDHLAGFTAPLDVTTTAWDVSPGREIAVATTAGLLILDHTLATETAVPGTAATEALLASVRRPSGELLVLAGMDGAGTWWLHGVDPLNPSSIALGSRDLVACAVGDANSDGSEDVMFSQRCNHRALLMVQAGVAVPFTMLAALEIPLIATSSALAPNNNAVPVFTDLDGDGDADLVHPVTSDQSVAVARAVGGAGASISLVALDNTNMCGGLREAVVQQTPARDLEVVLPFTVNGAFPPAATHIEVAVWLGGSNVVHDELRCEEAVSLQRLPSTASSVTLRINGAQEIGLDPFGMLLLQLRPIRVVTVGGAEVIEQTYRGSNYVLASDEWEPNLTAMRALPQAAPQSEVPLLHELFGLEWGGDTNGGIGVGGVIGVDPPPPTNPPGGGGGTPTGPE